MRVDNGLRVHGPGCVWVGSIVLLGAWGRSHLRGGALLDEERHSVNWTCDMCTYGSKHRYGSTETLPLLVALRVDSQSRQIKAFELTL
jgi:hypothetical protein